MPVKYVQIVVSNLSLPLLTVLPFLLRTMKVAKSRFLCENNIENNREDKMVAGDALQIEALLNKFSWNSAHQISGLFVCANSRISTQRS